METAKKCNVYFNDKLVNENVLCEIQNSDNDQVVINLYEKTSKPKVEVKSKEYPNPPYGEWYN